VRTFVRFSITTVGQCFGIKLQWTLSVVKDYTNELPMNTKQHAKTMVEGYIITTILAKFETCKVCIKVPRAGYKHRDNRGKYNMN